VAAGLASVTVTGTGLAGATQVAFNGDPSPHIVSNTATSVVAQVPVDATNGPLTVTTAAGTSAPSVAVFKPLAKISGSSGEPAQVGDTVTVNGYDFTATGATPTVKLGTLALTPGSPTATSFTVTIPDGALTGTLTVTNANGTASSPTPLHVKPTISGGPTPSQGPAGTVVTLTGNTFTGTSHVTIGGVTALAIVDSHTLQVTVPAAALTAPIAVTSAGGTTSSSTFTVDPKITSFTPTSAAGAPVTITGSGFGLGADTRVVKVGPVTATNVTYVSPTSLKFVVPNGAATRGFVPRRQHDADQRDRPDRNDTRPDHDPPVGSADHDHVRHQLRQRVVDHALLAGIRPCG
jgi:large repetitive protein